MWIRHNRRRSVLIDCHRFDHERQELETISGCRISVKTLVPMILVNPILWEAAAAFVASVMRTLRALERKRKQQTE